MSLRKLNGFGRPPQDLSLTSLWSALYAPPIVPLVPPQPQPPSDYPTDEIVNPTELTDNTLNMDVTTSIVTNTLSITPSIQWWAEITGSDGTDSNTYGCMDVVNVSDGHITISNLQSTVNLYDANDNTSSVYNLLLSGPPSSNYTVKYDKNGAFVWVAPTIQANSTNGMQNASLAVDSSENIVEFQLFSDALSSVTAYNSSLAGSPINPSEWAVNAPNGGAIHSCLTKRLPTGMPVWMALLAAPQADQYVYPVKTVTIGEDIYTYFLYQASVDVYSARSMASPAFSITSVGSTNGGLVKFTTDGVAQWSSKFGELPPLSVDGVPGKAYPKARQQAAGDMCTDGVNLFIQTSFPFGINSITYVNPDTSSSNITSQYTRSLAVMCISPEGFLQWNVVMDIYGGDANIYSPQSVRAKNGKLYVTFVFSATVEVIDSLLQRASIETTAFSAIGLLVLDASTGELYSLTKLAQAENIRQCTYEVNNLSDSISYLTAAYSDDAEGLQIFDLNGSQYANAGLSALAPSIVTMVYNKDIPNQRFNAARIDTQAVGGWMLGNTALTHNNELLVATAFSGNYTGSPDVVGNLYNFTKSLPYVLHQSFVQPPSGTGFTPLLLKYSTDILQLQPSAAPTQPVFKYITYRSTNNCAAKFDITVRKDGQQYTSVIFKSLGSTLSLYYDGTTWYVLSGVGIEYIL